MKHGEQNKTRMKVCKKKKMVSYTSDFYPRFHDLIRLPLRNYSRNYSIKKKKGKRRIIDNQWFFF